jgi:hypothetical protein
MTYNPLIPQGDNSPANQVSPIQTNYSQFASVFSTKRGGNTYNHTAVNGLNQGDHETVILQNQLTDPTITDNFAAIYATNAASKAGKQPQLWMRILKYLPNQFVTKNPGNPPIQLTYNQVNTTGPIYQSFLPGGYLLYWGQTSISSPMTSIPITLSPTPTTIIIAIAYPNSTTSGVARFVGTTIKSDNTGFTIFTQAFSSGSVPFTWMAIALA